MLNNFVKCNECKHQHVCKYQELYNETYEKLNKEVNTPFQFNLCCDNFLKCEDISTENPKKIDYDLFRRAYEKTSITKCEGCPTYERIKRGECIIGDQCSFCPNSPTRIICNEITTTHLDPNTTYELKGSSACGVNNTAAGSHVIGSTILDGKSHVFHNADGTIDVITPTGEKENK